MSRQQQTIQLLNAKETKLERVEFTVQDMLNRMDDKPFGKNGFMLNIQHVPRRAFFKHPGLKLGTS